MNERNGKCWGGWHKAESSAFRCLNTLQLFYKDTLELKGSQHRGRQHPEAGSPPKEYQSQCTEIGTSSIRLNATLWEVSKSQNVRVEGTLEDI